jgi:flagella basal body P-ring formation protein FlgA
MILAVVCHVVRRQRRLTAGALLVISWAAVSACREASGAEFQLRPQCQSRGGVITLGDVADVFGVDPRQAERLAGVELLPAPPAGQSRFVRVREIQDILLARGLNLAEHRFSGANQVMIGGVVEAKADRSGPVDMKRAVRVVREGIVRYLQEEGAPREATELEFQLTDAQARSVLKSSSRVAFSGGRSPWTGAQKIHVTATSIEETVPFVLDVEVSTPPQVVVAAKGLPRGVIVRPEDVVLTSAIPASEQGDAIRSLDEVVGRETTRAVAEGRMFDRSVLRSPVMVRRGDVVTVFARSAGIRVRTLARARDEGGVGDLISVESLQERKAYFARVSGAHEVEVYAHATQAVDSVAQDQGMASRAAATVSRATTIRR